MTSQEEFNQIVAMRIAARVELQELRLGKLGVTHASYEKKLNRVAVAIEAYSTKHGYPWQEVRRDVAQLAGLVVA